MIALLVAFMAVGCVTEEANERSSRELATAIWNEVDSDLEVIHSILRNVVHMDYMLGLEDAEREAYIARYLPDLKGSNGRYLLTLNTAYNTRYTTTFETGDKRLSDGGEWHVCSPSSIAFDMEIKPKGDGSAVIATFNELIISESSGTAQLEISYDMEPNDDGLNEAIIEYKGNITMVDPEASRQQPLTLTTNVTYMEYHEFLGMVAGSLKILCTDKLYGTEDRVNVSISYNPRRVYLECYGEQHTIYN